MSTRLPRAVAQDSEPAVPAPVSDEAQPARIAPLREWLAQVADGMRVQLVVANGVSPAQLDAPLLGCIAGRPTIHTLEALAFVGGCSLAMDGDVIHMEARDSADGLWGLISGPPACEAFGSRSSSVDSRSAGELSDATLAYALTRSAETLRGAIFALPAVFDEQRLVRLNGDERSAVQLAAALAASCESMAVGFGPAAFVLTPALPGEAGFERVGGRVWMRRVAAGEVAAALNRVVSLDIAAGSIEAQSAALAAAIGATESLGGLGTVLRTRPGARFAAEGRFSDVAEIWSGLRQVEWSLVTGPAGVEFVLRAAGTPSTGVRSGPP
jgi:hypothetical protein